MAHGHGPLLFFWLLFHLSDAPSDPIEVVTVHPGDNVTLSCHSPDHSISVVEWTRPDLEPEYVLLTIDGHLETKKQHPSFKDRVELVDRDLKDGNVSLILKNVSRHDAGTYECRVKPDGSRREKRAIIDSEPIRNISLQVTDSGSNSGSWAGNSSPVGLYIGLAVALLLAVVGLLIYLSLHKKRSGAPADDDDNEASGGSNSQPLMKTQ